MALKLVMIVGQGSEQLSPTLTRLDFGYNITIVIYHLLFIG